MDAADDSILVPLAGEWALWSDFVLRSAGFPVRRVDALQATELATLTDELLALEERVRDHMRVARGPQLQAAGDDLWRLLRKSNRKRGDDSVVEFIAEGDALRAAVARTFEHMQHRLHDEVAQQASEPSFSEALAWQNRRALLQMRKNMRAKPRMARYAAATLAKYLQRYCTKNDTAGFFGPLQWGRIQPRTEPIGLIVGSGLTARCHAYLEHWAVQAAAELAEAVPGVRDALAPRIHPLYSLREGGELWSPMMPVTLPAPSAALMRIVDGARTAAQIAAMGVELGCFPTPESALAALEEFAKQGWIIWGRDVPTDGSPYEGQLEKQLAAIADEQLRNRALAPLRRLEALRDAALAARGDADAVVRALGDLDAEFEALTRRPAQRLHGKTYAARTLVSLQCTRNVTLTLGARFVEAIRPLTFVLESARWLSYHLSRAYRIAAGRVYENLRAQTGDDEVPLLRFWLEIAPMIPEVGGEFPPEASEVMVEFERKWDDLLAARDGIRRLELTIDDLAERVAKTFAVDGAGFPNACNHSPDLLIAASSAEALRNDDFFVVLGEIHPFFVSVEQEIFMAEHPDRDRIETALDVSFPSGRIFMAKSERGLRTGTFPLGHHPNDVALELPDGSRSSWPRERTIAASEIVVKQEGDALMFRERAGSRSWNSAEWLVVIPPLSFFSRDRGHAPRVTVERFVLSRERWCFRAGDLGFAALGQPCARWVGTRRWAREAGLPRRSFCRLSKEPKPFYFDLDAPHYVELFCKGVRAEAENAVVTITEMLPLPEQCWLQDADDNRYTSELRFVVRDLRPAVDAHRGLGSR